MTPENNKAHHTANNSIDNTAKQNENIDNDQNNAEHSASKGLNKGVDFLAKTFFIAISLTILCYAYGVQVLNFLLPKKTMEIESIIISSENNKYTTFTTDADVIRILQKCNDNSIFCYAETTASIHEKLMTLPLIQNIVSVENNSKQLYLKIIENTPIATYKDKYVDERGRVFSLKDEPYVSAPSIAVKYEQDIPLLIKNYQLIKHILKANDLAVAKLTFKSPENWEIELTNNIILRLGAVDITKSIENFLVVFNNMTEIPNKEINYMDLRYKYGVAIDFKAKKQNNEQ